MRGSSIKIPDLPWPYKKLDPVAVAEAAYRGILQGGLRLWGIRIDYRSIAKRDRFPFYNDALGLVYCGAGRGGRRGIRLRVLEWAAHAIFLVTGGLDKKPREASYAIIQDVFLWYEQTALPDYRPSKPKYEIIKTISASNLCHVSVSKWCKASKFKSFSKERSERCAWLTAAVAKHTAETLNKYADGAFKIAYPLSAAAEACRSCHDKGSKLENTRAVTDCGGCHFTPTMKPEHPKM